MFYRIAASLLLSTLPVMAEAIEVGRFAAKIVPERISVLTLPDRGTITDLVKPEGRIQAGTVVAVLNKQRTQEAHEDMELQIARERLNKRDEVQKLRNQRRKVQFYNSLSPAERRFNTDFTPEETPTKTTLQDIDERIALLEKELATMERRKRNEFAIKHDPLTLRMPFTGRLQYNITLPEDLSKPFEHTENVRTFATACDDSAFSITITVSESNLSLLDEKKFGISVKLPGDKKLTGTYSHRRVERANSGGDMLVYFFRLPKEDSDTAYNMLGSNTMAVLTYDAGDGVLHVSKAELVAHPRAAECENWEQLIRIAHPGYSILLIGQREIVLTPSQAN
ncbi:MAG: hypothetical protein II295_05950 [Akkermansia sp.]|nr:hypothetical protein [Akkermansia sp.]